MDRAASGGSAIVLVEGEAGIGKTRLLAETLEQARARSLRVAAGRAEELERTRPFGLLADTLGCVRSSSDPRRAAIAALLAIRAGDQGPMTVSSDPGLQFQAVDAFVDLPVALIGCLRPCPHPHELERTLQTLHAAGAQRLPLGQLDQRAVVELVAEAVAAQPGPGLLAEVAGARGNPLFVTELGISTRAQLAAQATHQQAR